MKGLLPTLFVCLLADCHCTCAGRDNGDGECLLQLSGAHKALAREAAGDEPNPPTWPASVYVFDATMIAKANATMIEIFNTMGPLATGKFSSDRYAFLFKPGTYELDVPVGFYTQVIGLGATPSDVTFVAAKGVFAPSEADNNNFNTFWKAGENFANKPTSGSTLWSVSQAAPLRRVRVHGDLLFGSYDADSIPSKGSGGFIANVEVDGRMDLVRQQQWLIRNCRINQTSYFQSPSRSVNFVYVGTVGGEMSQRCTNAASNPVSPSPQFLNEDHTPVQLEKPYLSITMQGKYNLHIPQPIWFGQGVAWNSSQEIIDGFEKVFVATNATSLSLINAKLAIGRHVILTPGIYHLSSAIRIGWNQTVQQQVLLGLGMATLIPIAGTACVEIGPAPGVRVAGVLLQAGNQQSQRLLWWSPGGNPKNPGLLADVFARVGGPDTEVVSAEIMFEINGDYVVMDNVWAWRADCCQNGCGTCAVRYCDHGVVVNGHNVIAYGLFSEHCQKDLLIWNGEQGRCYFYQSEMDSFARQAWDDTPTYGVNGVSGYRVNAQDHQAFGIGVYAYFIEPGNKVKAGIVVPNDAMIQNLQCPFYWNLNPAWYWVARSYATNESGIISAVRVQASQPTWQLEA